MPECKCGIPCVWTGRKACRRTDGSDQKDRKTADHHETDTKCYGYYRDRKGGRSRWCGCIVSDQYLTGMKIDINRRTFAVANKTGGVSGPIVHPIAVRMVYQTAQAVNIPIIGMGGIATPEDAIEMILAGASAVSVGTANFYNPNATIEIIDGIEAYMKKNGFESVKDMVGIVK